MPLMLGFCKSYQLRGPKQRPQPDPDTGERVHSTLLTIDDADRRPAVQPGLAERLDRGHRGAARGDHVLDETDAFAVLEHTLEAVAGPVFLGLLADDQEGQARGVRGGSRERYGAQLRPREPDGLGLELSHGPSDPLPQRAEQVRPGLKAILVEVVAGAPARAEHEIPLEVGVLAQRGAELGVCQLSLQARGSGGRAAAAAQPRLASRARSSTRRRSTRPPALAGARGAGGRAASRRANRRRAARR